MKKVFLLAIVVLLFFGFGCQQTVVEEPATEVSEPIVNEDGLLKETVYTTFVINTHDWVNPVESIATMNRIIDLHEDYELPVDIYLNDQVVQIYEEQAPDLIERLKNSSFVAVSYHLRPPSPYYWNFDWLGLEDMSNKELMATLEDYEEHRIDLASGQITAEPGGYEFLKDLIGYPPYAAVVTGSPKVAKILAGIFKDKGALFTVSHSGTSAFGDELYSLKLRPEDVEVKVYEPRGHKAGELFLTEALEKVLDLKTSFINLKWHENNFYTWYTPWSAVYTSGDRVMLEPPWNLSLAGQGSSAKNEDEQAEQWNRYEECLVYVKNHPEIFTVINAKDLAGMIKNQVN